MSRIMVVDDEPDLVVLVEMILHWMGHQVIGVMSCEEALEKLKEERPDLILLDVMMPRIDGWETLKLIRKQGGLERVPIAMLTATVPTYETLKRTEIEELFDYISKPFTKDSLEKNVGELLATFDSIEQKKTKLRTMGFDVDTIQAYEGAARGEWLHRRLYNTLKIIEHSKDGSQDSKDITSVLIDQLRAIELFKKRREGIERQIIK